MYVGRTVFAQVMEHFPADEFQKCVARYDGDFRKRIRRKKGIFAISTALGYEGYVIGQSR